MPHGSWSLLSWAWSKLMMRSLVAPASVQHGASSDLGHCHWLPSADMEKTCCLFPLPQAGQGPSPSEWREECLLVWIPPLWRGLPHLPWTLTPSSRHCHSTPPFLWESLSLSHRSSTLNLRPALNPFVTLCLDRKSGWRTTELLFEVCVAGPAGHVQGVR